MALDKDPLALGADAGVHHGHVDGAWWEIAPRCAQKESALEDVLRRDVMGQVDDGRLRVDTQYDPFITPT